MPSARKLNEEVLSSLLDAGMNVMRLNFSQSDYEEHGQRIKNLRAVLKRTGQKAAILLDTKDPEIRTMKLVNGADVSLRAGKFLLPIRAWLATASAWRSLTTDSLRIWS